MHCSNKPKNSKIQNGFTLIEILLTISIVAILSAIAISVLNPTQTRNRTEDAVRVSNLQSIAQALETFYAVEGKLPIHKFDLGNPLDAGDADALSTYLNSWPTTSNGDVYNYRLINSADGASTVQVMCLSVPMVTDSSLVLKYVSPFGDDIVGKSECVGKILRNCSATVSCTEAIGLGLDISSCEQVSNGVAC